MSSAREPLRGANDPGGAPSWATAESARSKAGQRPEDKLKEQSDAFQQKRQRNPFAQSLRKAELYKDQRGDPRRQRKSQGGNGDANGAADLDGGGQVMDEDSLGQLLLEQGHLPESSDEYFAEITTKVDTSEILEIVQVFSHQ